MFQMMSQFRLGDWHPGDPLPPTVDSMMQYFKQKNVVQGDTFSFSAHMFAPVLTWLIGGVMHRSAPRRGEPHISHRPPEYFL